jgi:hypothetical protein
MLLWIGSGLVAVALVDEGELAHVLSQVVSVFAFAIVGRICGVLLRES